MQELPTDPASSAAILRLETKVEALRNMVAVLLADSPGALRAVKHHREMAAAFALTEDQVRLLANEFEVVAQRAQAFRNAQDPEPPAQPD